MAVEIPVYPLPGEEGALQFNVMYNHNNTLIIETANTVDAADTIPVSFAKFGITTVLAVMGYKHTTDNSVVVTEDPTIAVASSILTLTVPAGTDDDKRVYEILYV